MTQIIYGECLLYADELYRGKCWEAEIPNWPDWYTGMGGDFDFYTRLDEVIYNIELVEERLCLYQVWKHDGSAMPVYHRVYVREADRSKVLDPELDRILTTLPDWLMEQVL